jgi:hypothetical protein
MKSRFTYLVLTAGLSAILGSSTVSAQGPSEVANVPFDFHVNASTLPAGTYTVSRETGSGITRLRDQTGRGIFVATLGADTNKANNPRLTFACYAEDCVLSTIWMPDGLGYGVAQSRSDKELTRKLGVVAEMRSVRLAAR